MTKEDITHEIADSFSRMKRAMHLYASSHFDELGLTFGQLGTLRVVESNQPISQKQLATIMQMTPGAISQTIEVLEAADCLVRTTDKDDRRSKYLSISPHGKTVLNRYNELRTSMLTHAVADTPQAELEHYLHVQNTIITWLESQHTK